MTAAGRVNQLAHALHGYRCLGVQEGYCDPGSRHAATFRVLAAAIIASTDPVGVLHDATCDAFLDRVIQHCPARAQHLAWLTEQFSRYWTVKAAS